jgi:hypothetical protein
MGVLFESILLFSLAVLIILVGMLVYYFKKRIVEIEHKTAKCLEIAQDVYIQHMQMKNEVFSILYPPQPQAVAVHPSTSDDKIHVELSEESDDDDDESDDEDEESDDDESIDDDSSSDEKKVKIVNVDLTFPEECEINIDEEESEDDEIIDEPEPQITSLEPVPIVVNKVESVSKEDLQKMTPASLKSLLIAKGVSAETVNKLKKKELIDMLL